MDPGNAAVEKVLSWRRGAHEAAIQQLTAADRELSAVVFDVAVEAVEQRASAFVAKLNEALRFDAVLRSVAIELRARGNRDVDNKATYRGTNRLFSLHWRWSVAAISCRCAMRRITQRRGRTPSTGRNPC